MKFTVHVSKFGTLPFWVIAPNGTVVSTFNSSRRAEKLVTMMNKDPTWLNKYVNN